jgi:DNA-binding NarL/FixJ family response regulator
VTTTTADIIRRVGAIQHHQRFLAQVDAEYRATRAAHAERSQARREAVAAARAAGLTLDQIAQALQVTRWAVAKLAPNPTDGPDDGPIAA